MTLRLAAFQHFCGRFADALLTSWSPLTYERGDFLAADALSDKEAEEEVWGPDELARECGVTVHESRPWWAPLPGEPGFPDSPVGVSTSPPIVPPTGLDPSPTIIESAPPPQVCGDGPDGDSDIPPSPPSGHPISLPMFRFGDLQAIAAEYIEDSCSQKPLFPGKKEWSHHVAEIVVSAVLAELTGLAWDQSHQKEAQK
jgi:hypothetical protein